MPLDPNELEKLMAQVDSQAEADLKKVKNLDAISKHKPTGDLKRDMKKRAKIKPQKTKKR